MIWKAILLSLFTLACDIGFTAVVYIILPHTAQLNSNLTIVRQNLEGRSTPIKINPKSSSYVHYQKIPEVLRKAVIVLEDSKFYEHRGFDFSQIDIAVEQWADDGRRLRGASTISQQLVKNLYLSSERSFWRKFVEALITIKLELQVPKWRILELYLNIIDWGKNLIGISAASEYYFHKRPEDLSVKEAVILASIIPNPSIYGEKWDKLFVRRQALRALERLYKRHIININEYRSAIVQHLGD